MINIEEVKEKIKKAFSWYEFHDESHTYTYLDENDEEKTIGISTTQFIHSYSQPFDEDKMSRIVAKKKKTTPEAVLEQWAYDRDLACEYGTLAHLYLECKWMDYPFFYDTKPFIERFGFDPVSDKFERMIPALEAFYQTFKERLILIGAEVVIASKDYDIAGSIDLLAYSKKLDAIIIIDNKTNKEIKKTSYNNQTMLEPLNYIPDSNFWHYSLQGAIYKKILEYETGIPVSKRKFLIWFDSKEEKYNIIECGDLDYEANVILEIRKNNKEKI